MRCPPVSISGLPFLLHRDGSLLLRDACGANSVFHARFAFKHHQLVGTTTAAPSAKDCLQPLVVAKRSDLRSNLMIVDVCLRVCVCVCGATNKK